MALVAQVLEYYNFKILESGKNKCLMERKI